MPSADKNTKSNKARFLATAVVSALLGSHAMEIGKLIVLYYDRFTGSGVTAEKYQVEFGLLVLGFGFLVVIALEVLKADPDGDKEELEGLVATVVVGLVGGLFSILENTADDTGYLTNSTGVAIFYLIVLGTLFLLPIFVIRWNETGLKGAGAILKSLCIAGAAAFVLAGVVQLLVTSVGEFCRNSSCGVTLESRHFNPHTTSFFLSAPMAAGLFAPWVILAAEPIANPQRWHERGIAWRQIWLAALIVTMSGFVTFFATAMYWPKHAVEPHGWLAFYSISQQLTLFYFVVLQLGSIFYALTVLLIYQGSFKPKTPISRDLPWLAGAFAFGCFCAVIVVWTLPHNEMNNWLKQLLFIIGHGMTAMITIGACFIGLRWPKSKSILERPDGV